LIKVGNVGRGQLTSRVEKRNLTSATSQIKFHHSQNDIDIKFIFSEL
jgi:hypothetical protein